MPRLRRSKGEIALAKRVREGLRARYLSDDASVEQTSQRQLAKRLNLSPQTVNGWFAVDPAFPNPLALVALAKRDNLSLDSLLLGEGPPLRGQVAKPGDLAKTLEAHLRSELARFGSSSEVDAVIRSGESPLEHLVAYHKEQLLQYRAWLARAVGRKLGANSPLFGPDFHPPGKARRPRG